MRCATASSSRTRRRPGSSPDHERHRRGRRGSQRPRRRRGPQRRRRPRRLTIAVTKSSQRTLKIAEAAETTRARAATAAWSPHFSLSRKTSQRPEGIAESAETAARLREDQGHCRVPDRCISRHLQRPGVTPPADSGQQSGSTEAIGLLPSSPFSANSRRPPRCRAPRPLRFLFASSLACPTLAIPSPYSAAGAYRASFFPDLSQETGRIPEQSWRFAFQFLFVS